MNTSKVDQSTKLFHAGGGLWIENEFIFITFDLIFYNRYCGLVWDPFENSSETSEC